jgi:hypothetical protein
VRVTLIGVPSGEDGVQVGRDNHHRPAGRTGPAAQAHDIAFRVHLDVGQAMGLQHGHIGLAANLLLEGWGGDFGELDGVGDDPVGVAVELGDGGLERRAASHRLDPGVGVGGRLGVSEAGGGQEGESGDGAFGHGHRTVTPEKAAGISTDPGALRQTPICW